MLCNVVKRTKSQTSLNLRRTGIVRLFEEAVTSNL